MRILRTLILCSASACILLAQQQLGRRSLPVQQDVSEDLISMALANPLASVTVPAEVVQKHGPLPDEIGSATASSVNAALTPTFVQDASIIKPLFSALPGPSFEGLGGGTPGYTITSIPPDTTMAVGPNHVVQWVNSHIAIYNKAGLPQLPAPGFITGNTLFAGFGGLCQSTNRGDPLVAYDRVADRWVFSQFAFAVNASGNPITPYLQCFAVSTGPNPAGPYNRYAYSYNTAGPGGVPAFNDYGKLGVWPDAYYVTYNMFGGSPAGSNVGVALCAYDRAAMIAGAAAVELCAPTTFYGGGASFLPSDLEGATTPPPAGTPNFMMRQSTAPALRYLKFKVNSFTPANFTFDDGFGGAPGSFVNIPLIMTRACNGGGGTCINQPGTATQLDTLGDRLMYRLGYRNRAGVESLVVSMSADPDGAGAQRSAVRWWEIRNPSGNPPTLFQNSTFNPDSTNRWMSSLAMDKNGNMAMAYSVSSGSVFPGIRITGRLRTEIRNQMHTEAVLVNGGGSQTGFTRWGDYSTMRVNPADDCTFWYTTEYYNATSAFTWRTRIASYKYNNCQ